MTESPTSTQPLPPGGLFRRIRLTNWQIILIALVVVGGRLVIDFSQRIVEGQQKAAEQRQLEAEIAALVREQKDLEAAKAYYASPAFVEAWAHNEGKMVREGEVLVVPLYERAELATASSPVGQPASPSVAPWAVWWTLFFDSAPPFIGG